MNFSGEKVQFYVHLLLQERVLEKKKVWQTFARSMASALCFMRLYSHCRH